MINIEKRFTRAEAKRKGFTIDDYCYPPLAYRGERFNTYEEHTTYTIFEEKLIRVIKRMEKRIEKFLLGHEIHKDINQETKNNRIQKIVKNLKYLMKYNTQKPNAIYKSLGELLNELEP